MTVTKKNFIEQSVLGVRSNGTYGWRVTASLEAGPIEVAFGV